MNKLSRDEQRTVVGALCEGSSIRSIERMTGIHRDTIMRMGVRESFAAGAGARSTLAKAAELMFVEAMRRYVEMLPPGGKGWLAGVRDTHVGQALSLLHAQPARDWTVDELAQQVALSRSALAERFTELVGEPSRKIRSSF